jgi:hypothetical protein
MRDLLTLEEKMKKMASKCFLLGMLVMVLVFGMTVVGCNDEGKSEPDGSEPDSNVEKVSEITLEPNPYGGYQKLISFAQLGLNEKLQKDEVYILKLNFKVSRDINILYFALVCNHLTDDPDDEYEGWQEATRPFSFLLDVKANTQIIKEILFPASLITAYSVNSSKLMVDTQEDKTKIGTVTFTFDELTLVKQNPK